jgi:hypothetical protein
MIEMFAWGPSTQTTIDWRWKPLVLLDAEHVCVSASTEEYHLSVNAAMRLVPCFCAARALFSSSSSRICAQKSSFATRVLRIQ